MNQTRTLGSSSASFRNKGRPKPKLTPAQLKNLKLRSKCRQCHQYGHWSTDHNPDGTLKAGTPSSNSIQANSKENRKSDSANDGTLRFGCAHITNVDESESQISTTSDSTVDFNRSDKADLFSIKNKITKLLNDDVCDDTHPDTSHTKGLNHAQPFRSLIGSDDDDNWYTPEVDMICDVELDMTHEASELNTLTASMARYYPTRFVKRQPPIALGPMVDDGAPYSALGSTELRLLGMSDDSLDPIQSSMSTFKFW